MSDRRQEAYAVRLEAAEMARSRQHPVHRANGDEERYAPDKYFMSFTKGLPHNPKTGLLHDPLDFVEFRRAIDDGFVDPFSDRVRHGARYEVKDISGDYKVCKVSAPPNNFRQWEAPTAGVVYELEGADSHAVTMEPAPALLSASGDANPELIFEMAEVYELAITRDISFNAFEKDLVAGVTNAEREGLKHSYERLNEIGYIKDYPKGSQPGRPRKLNEDGKLDFSNVFRGSSPGVDVGPYLSQFLLIGNIDRNDGGSVADGVISYGVLDISQKVPIATPKTDYMLEMKDYVSVQRGLKQKSETYLPDSGSNPRPLRRFISTPRDLATYVHHDALYEAYLNACLILLRMNTPFDPAFDQLSGVGVAAESAEYRRQAGGFALWGGPHILTLVTEVATRALKAVRYQKFNNHIRLRPEALAARIELVRRLDPEVVVPDDEKFDPSLVPDALKASIEKYEKELSDNKDTANTSTLAAIAAMPGNTKKSYFLPMAFPEGSPMHPSYGAGHATVAGACVTILKAFFDTSAVLVKTTPSASQPSPSVAFKRKAPGDRAVLYRAPSIGGDPFAAPSDALTEFVETPTEAQPLLTLEGELNKLAANISIGRDMAGVHFFTDYYDSLRMGEKIALTILEEQALTYLTDPFVLSIPTFDGSVERIGRR